MNGAQRARTNVRGRFAISVAPGDSVRIRAMGFREVRFAVTDDSVAIALDAVPTVLPAYVTTVGNRVIRAGETPASVAVVEDREIASAGATAAATLLRRLPGLEEVATPPSRSTIAIRGLDGPRVLVLVDGEPVPGSLIDNRDIGRLSTIATERIEVTKGPSSVEFGSDALGGVINLVTAAPPDRTTVDATARSGTLGRHEATASVGGTAADIGYRIAGGWRQQDRVAAVNAEGSALNRVYDVRVELRTTDNARRGVRGTVQWTRERQRWPVGGGYNGFVDDRGAQVMAEGRTPAAGGTFRLRASGQLYAYQFRQAAGDVPIAGSADSLEQRERTGRLALAWTRAAGRHTVDAGTQLSWRWMVAPDKVTGDSANDRVAEAFVRDAWNNGPVLAVAGSRVTSSVLWGTTATPSVGLAWQARPSMRLRGTVASGFRAPSFKEIRYTFANPGAGYMVDGNPDLEPERSVNTSIGSSWAPASGVTLELEVYRNDVSRLIATRLMGTSTAGLQVYRNVNVARARLEGIEVSARTSVAGTEATFGFHWLAGRDRDSGETLEGHAARTGLLRLTRNWLTGNTLTTDMAARYTGPTRLGDTAREELLSVDVQVRARLTPSLEWSLGVNNLLDRRPALWTPAFQRQVYTGLRVVMHPMD